MQQVKHCNMALQVTSSNIDDSLLQLALSIAPNTEDPFEEATQQQQQDGTVADKNPNLFAQKVPPMAFDPQSVESMLASQLAKLSVDDREKAYMDVHGVPSDCLAETPELIHQSLAGLQNEIFSLPEKLAYNLAERLNSEYVHDRNFRLAFLRCEKFDCPKAALRIVRHFQMKLDLFGVEKLVMDITQDDLDAEAMEVLHSCDGRFLNKFDRAGRIVSLNVTTSREFKADATVSPPLVHSEIDHKSSCIL